jgi:quercetin dioxygenase-like cupin family protein
MDTSDFETELQTAGYETSVGGFAAGHDLEAHAHPYDLRALVLDGEFTIGVDGVERTYRSGDVFELDRGMTHVERVGPNGVQFLIGRRHPAADA